MNSTIDQSSSESYEFRALSDLQKKVLAILPIPTALLSIFGSTIIIVMLMKVRKTKSWIPYQRLLFAMSVCDILSSLTLAVGAFLYPKETSDKVWVIGNDASCSAIGFLNQISYSGTLYNGMLSFYFLFTARFGMKNEQIQRRIEPAMHLFSIGFPFVTAFVGLFMGVYNEPELGIGCWVNRWPDNCGEGPGGTGEECQSPLVAWIFGAWIAIFVLATLVVNNAVIWVFVHKRTRRVQGTRTSRAPGMVEEKSDDTSDSHSHQSDEETKASAAGRTSHAGGISIASSFRTMNTGRMSGTASVSTAAQREFQATQNKRLKLVGSQAFLFVGCYFVSNIWTYVLRLYEAQTTEYVEEKELAYHYYSILVLQAALMPLQGLFNMIVFIRPKALRLRNEFPNESKWSIFHRVVFGEAARTQDSGSGERVTGKLEVKAGPLPRKGVSSLTLASEVPQQVTPNSPITPIKPPEPIAETPSPDQQEEDGEGSVIAPPFRRDLSAILETSERTATERSRTASERNLVDKIIATKAASNGQEAPRSRYSVGSSSDSSLFMQGTGWSSSLESSSRSLQTRASIPEGSIAFISSQMPQSGSSSDGIGMHTGWSTCSESTGASKRISKSDRKSSSSNSTYNMHTGWSDDGIPADQIRQRVSMNLEAKRKQLMDMQYNDDGSESSGSIEETELSKSGRELHDPEDAKVPSKIAPGAKPRISSAQLSEANSSGQDSFFASTGWSLDDMPLVADSPAVTSSKKAVTVPQQQNKNDSSASTLGSFGMKTGWSMDELPLVSPQASPSVSSRKGNTSMNLDDLQPTIMSPMGSKKSSGSIQMMSSASLQAATIQEEEGSMQSSDDDDNADSKPPPPPPLESSSPRNSATRVTMDGTVKDL